MGGQEKNGRRGVFEGIPIVKCEWKMVKGEWGNKKKYYSNKIATYSPLTTPHSRFSLILHFHIKLIQTHPQFRGGGIADANDEPLAFFHFG
jgi:hypothetical protein